VTFHKTEGRVPFFKLEKVELRPLSDPEPRPLSDLEPCLLSDPGSHFSIIQSRVLKSASFHIPEGRVPFIKSKNAGLHPLKQFRAASSQRARAVSSQWSRAASPQRSRATFLNNSESCPKVRVLSQTWRTTQVYVSPKQFRAASSQRARAASSQWIRATSSLQCSRLSNIKKGESRVSISEEVRDSKETWPLRLQD